MDAQFAETAREAVRQLRKAAYRLQDDHQDPDAAEMLDAADALADALALHGAPVPVYRTCWFCGSDHATGPVCGFCGHHRDEGPDATARPDYDGS